MPEQPQLQKAFRYAAIGAELVLFFGLLLAGGIWLDRKLQTQPAFSLVGAAAGFGLGLYKMIVDLRREERKSRNDRPDGPQSTDRKS